jgi:RND family efflux transporter MFP subunit
MTFPKKIIALATGLAAAVSIAILPVTFAAQDARSEGDTLVVEGATVDWVEKSKVAALREGVIDRMELSNGMPVAKGKPIGYLHSEIAELSVKKAALAAKSQGPKAEAEAKKQLSLAVVAVNERLEKRQPGLVSYEEKLKAEAEVKVATAMVLQAREKVLLDEAELALAQRALEEHKIIAPFDGIVIERLKNAGERVGVNEAVVVLANMDKLKVWAYVPLENAFQIKVGQIVEIQPTLSKDRKGAPLAIEQKRVRGKITFVDPQFQPIGENAKRIVAEFDNKDQELMPGLKTRMTIYLNSAPKAGAGTIEARNGPGSVGR